MPQSGMPRAGMTMTERRDEGQPTSAVWLVGAGVVGCAIAREHLDRGVPIRLVDADADRLATALRQLTGPGRQLTGPGPTGECLKGDVGREGIAADRVGPIEPVSIGGELASVQIDPRPGPQIEAEQQDRRGTFLIESISERIEVKRDFFRAAETRFGDSAVLCSNTSSLTIGSIMSALRRPGRLCGMHFFMPVRGRDAVELVAAAGTDRDVIDAAETHIRRIGKRPLKVADAPGFVVNRMLVPYLNQAIGLLCAGATAEQIESAAMRYGMPMSPLELIDWIGTPTAFDAGRAFWQAFPQRIDPAPLLPAMVKRKRWGRGNGRGFYDYHDGRRDESLAAAVEELRQRYTRHRRTWDEQELLELLAIPMWIEAACLLADRVTDGLASIEAAMSGGLGYRPSGGWSGFFEGLGGDRIADAIETRSDLWHAMCPPLSLGLSASLRHTGCPRGAIEAVCGLTRAGRID